LSIDGRSAILKEVAGGAEGAGAASTVDREGGMMRQKTRALGALLAATIGFAILVPAAAATSGDETFDVTLVVSGATGERDIVTAVVVAKGVFSGNGRLVEVPNVPGDPDNVARDDLVFAEGTLHIVSTTVDVSASVNPRSCRGNLTILQTTEIVGGTGVFAAASGSFLSTLSGKASLARNPDRSCSFDLLPLHEEDKIELVGTLTF
jgi:hypothetical protein